MMMLEALDLGIVVFDTFFNRLICFHDSEDFGFLG